MDKKELEKHFKNLDETWGRAFRNLEKNPPKKLTEEEELAALRKYLLSCVSDEEK